MSTAPLDLRERRRRDMCRDISAAALDLFEQRGVATTTVGEIAGAAGISQSTFFRHFPTKEDAVIGVDPQVWESIRRWLDSTAADDVNLAGLEGVYLAVVQRTSAADADTLAHVRRVRRLVLDDAHLRAAAYAHDVETMTQLADALAVKLDGRESRSYTRLLAETAVTTLRVAFDTWVERLDRDDSADLSDIYRTACADLRRAVGQRAG